MLYVAQSERDTEKAVSVILLFFITITIIIFYLTQSRYSHCVSATVAICVRLERLTDLRSLAQVH